MTNDIALGGKKTNTENKTVFSLGFSHLSKSALGKYSVSDTTFLACQTSKSCFSLAKGSLRNNCLNKLNAVTWSIWLPNLFVKMTGEQLTGQKEWHPSSKQAHFPQPPKQTVVIIAKETKRFFWFFRANYERGQQYINSSNGQGRAK